MEITARFPNLGFQFQYENISIPFLGTRITIYGIIIAVAMLLGFIFVYALARIQKQNTNLYLLSAILALVGGIIGARLYYVIFSWDSFSGRPLSEIWNISNGGMAIYGGILFGAIVIAVICKYKKIRFGRMADIMCMGLLLAQVIGVWGNFFSNESFGEYTDGKLAMQIPLDAVQSSMVTSLMRNNLVTVGDTTYIQVRPLFLYESLWCLIVLIVLIIFTLKKKFDGEIFLRYLAGYGFGRCFIEWFRTDKLYIPGTKVSISLVVSIALFIICAVLAEVRRALWKKRRVIRERVEAEHPDEHSEDEVLEDEILDEEIEEIEKTEKSE